MALLPPKLPTVCERGRKVLSPGPVTWASLHWMHETFSPDERLTFPLIPILHGEGGRSGWPSVSYFYLKAHIQASAPEGLKGQAPLTELDPTLLLGPGS